MLPAPSPLAVKVPPSALLMVPEPAPPELPLKVLLNNICPALQTSVPSLRSTRPPSSLKALPVTVLAPCRIVVPVPRWSPKVKLAAPVTVKLPLPPIEPLDWLRLLTEEAAVIVNSPPVTPSVLLGLAPLPSTRLLMVVKPVLYVMVCAPATLTITSSAAPGNRGLVVQLVAVCQDPVVPVHVTTAAWPDSLPMAAMANSTATTIGFLASEQC